MHDIGALDVEVSDLIGSYNVHCTQDMAFGKLFIKVLAMGLQQPEQKTLVCELLEMMYHANPKHFIITQDLNAKFQEVGWRNI